MADKPVLRHCVRGGRSALPKYCVCNLLSRLCS